MIPDLTAEEIARFHSNIRQGDGCWPWGGETNNQGYGRFPIYRNGKRIRILAHKLAFYLASGEDLGGNVCRHRCDNPPCCNPEHLDAGTQADNIRDAIERGRFNSTGLTIGRAIRRTNIQARLVINGKRCPSCSTVKPFHAFHRNRSASDGLQGWCKECRLIRRRAA